MSIDKVIEEGTFTIWETFINALGLLPYTLLLIGGLLFLGFGLRDFIKEKKIKDNFKAGFFLTLLCLILPQVLSFSANHNAIEKWEEDYLSPYLSEQPEQRVEVETKIRIIEGHVAPAFERGSEVVYVDEVNDRVMTSFAFYRGKQLVHMTRYIVVEKSLDNSDKPYFSYKEVEKDMGWPYKKSSYYNPVLYVPENYEFEIVNIKEMEDMKEE